MLRIFISGLTLNFIFTSLALAFTVPEKFIWFEKNQKQVAYLQKGLWAQLETQVPPVSLSNISQKVVKSYPGVTIIKREGREGKKSSKALGDDQGSPVFSPTKSGNLLMVLTGGVIVHFEESFQEKDIRDWCATQKLSLGRKLVGMGNNFWLVETQPGIEVLKTLELIKDKPGVLSVAPNWWRPLQLK